MRTALRAVAVLSGHWRMAAPLCQCNDTSCPVHQGQRGCRLPATVEAVRVDMRSDVATMMCTRCGTAAQASGIYRIDPIQRTAPATVPATTTPQVQVRPARRALRALARPRLAQEQVTVQPDQPAQAAPPAQPAQPAQPMPATPTVVTNLPQMKRIELGELVTELSLLGTVNLESLWQRVSTILDPTLQGRVDQAMRWLKQNGESLAQLGSPPTAVALARNMPAVLKMAYESIRWAVPTIQRGFPDWQPSAIASVEQTYRAVMSS